jgi:hypothetical protein
MFLAVFLQDPLSGLSVALAREVVQRQTGATAVAILGLLPPTGASIACLHGALRRGLFRGAPLAALQAAQAHLECCSPPSAAAVSSATTGTAGSTASASAAATTSAVAAAPAKRGKKSAKPSSASDDGALVLADVVSSLHMLGDLLRCVGQGQGQGQGHGGSGMHLKATKSSKQAGETSSKRGGAGAVGGVSDGQFDVGDDGLGSDFEGGPSEPKRTKKQSGGKAFGPGADLAGALQRFKRERERPKKPQDWA